MKRALWYVPARLALLIAGVCVCAWAAFAQAEAVTVEQAAERIAQQPDRPEPAGQPDRVNVFVYVEEGADRGPIRAFAQEHGGHVRYEYKTVLPNVMNLRNIPVGVLNALEHVPGVQAVEEDQYHENLIKLDESTPLIHALQSQVTGAGYDADGTGVRVCVCDTGIDMDHLMYSDRIDTAASYDFANDDPNPEDDHGHGSHVAGIAVGRTGLQVDFGCEGPEPFQGVAPNATLIGVKVLNRNGGGTDSDIVAGIDHCADPALPGGQADVINLSIGRGQYSGACDSEIWAVAANNAVDAGVVVVAAAGNEGYSNALSTPACASKVIAVGASYKDTYPNCEDGTNEFDWCLDYFCFQTCTDTTPSVDDPACFSNNSDNLDVAAPGVQIWSASTAAGGSSITQYSGTSQASPHVAGLAALILGMDPTLTPAEVRQIIRDGAIDLGPTGFDRAYGYGRIDTIGSLALVGPGCSVPADCDDGLWCNGAEDCVSGSCVPGTPPDCNDGVACTDDSCNETTDSCDNLPNDAYCDDGNPCTDDYCDVDLDCQYVPDDTNSCDDEEFCNGAEFCSGGACQPGSDPCPGQGCDEVNDVCTACDSDGTCEAGEDCNNCPADCISGSGGAVCGNGVCEAGDGEDCQNCSADCNGLQTGKPSGRFCCGATEGCGDSRCNGGGWSCTTEPQGTSYCCGDGVCEGAEDSANCAIDCGAPPVCGDGTCDPDENQCNCPDDCGTPPSTETNCSDGIDNDCDGGADCSDPTGDCDSDPACSCLPRGEACTLDEECCSNRCHRGACK